MDTFVSKQERLERIKELFNLWSEKKHINISEYEHVKLSIHAEEQKSRQNSILTPFKACFDTEEVACTAACGKASIPLTQYDNLLDHLSRLIPTVERQIGLITYQNGIMNTVANFQKMGELALQHFPQNHPLCIGLYNPILFESNKLQGLLNHKSRLDDHFKSYFEEGQTRVVARMYVFFKQLMKKIQAINPKLIWIHIVHSEAGAISHLALSEIAKRGGIELFKKNLITVALGPIMPIAKEWTLDSYNIYSEGDYLVKGYRKKFNNNSGSYTYNLLTVPKERTVFSEIFTGIGCISLGAGITEGIDYLLHDHAFASNTYQKALSTYLLEIYDKLEKRVYS